MPADRDLRCERLAGGHRGDPPGADALPGGLDVFVGKLAMRDCTMEGLVESILNALLQPGIQQSLTAKLDAATAAFARGNDIAAAACLLP